MKSSDWLKYCICNYDLQQVWECETFRGGIAEFTVENEKKKCYEYNRTRFFQTKGKLKWLLTVVNKGQSGGLGRERWIRKRIFAKQDVIMSRGKNRKIAFYRFVLFLTFCLHVCDV